ncbi:MAG: AGE family epimerase/isomerase [Ignavibacteriales bacterium]|nr:AGE family epimerase/isomerase [Ignavibacteriales bacterium]
MISLTDTNSKNYLESIAGFYKTHLLENILPFWLKHSIDLDNGGYTFSLDKDGTILDTDKAMWIHGRFVWLLSELYNTAEKKNDWFKLAKHGIEFIDKYGFDSDGRMYFLLTKEGQPLRKRRYLFTESFACMAYSAFAKASNSKEYEEKALSLFKLILHYLKSPEQIPEKTLSKTRSMKSLSVPMINIVVGQTLRNINKSSFIDNIILDSINEIENDFMKEEFKAVLETVATDGKFINSFDGRLLNPGHAIETAWFIMKEGIIRNDEKIKQLGVKIFNWSWKWGWDNEFGGIIYYRDVKNNPCTEYWHDMKFWWPQCEAIIAALYAFKITGDIKYLKIHEQIHNYTFNLFPDNDYGEWFGYFHRDGRLSTTIKGNMWKGPFHIPRMLLTSWQLIESMKD